MDQPCGTVRRIYVYCIRQALVRRALSLPLFKSKSTTNVTSKTLKKKQEEAGGVPEPYHTADRLSARQKLKKQIEKTN